MIINIKINFTSISSISVYISYIMNEKIKIKRILNNENRDLVEIVYLFYDVV